MKNYNRLTKEDIDKMSFEELIRIPPEFLQENYFDVYSKLYLKTNDSIICLEDEYPYENSPNKIIYEVFPVTEGKKIIIYLTKKRDSFSLIGKSFASHCLEQVFDENDHVISETIKENPYYKK